MLKYSDAEIRREAELRVFKRLITEAYPSGLVSIVSDTFDFWNVITNIAAELKEDILARTPDELGLGKVVFRPDSGDPVKILTGYDLIGEYATQQDFFDAWDSRQSSLNEFSAVKVDGVYYEVRPWRPGHVTAGKQLSEAEVKGAVVCLADIFGATTNSKGYKTLNPRVGLIYGDSITIPRAEKILSRLAHKGFASDNVVFGIGSFTFQYNTRDTFGWAMKATYVEIDGVGMEIFKEPKTDNGVKKSARGLLRVDAVDGVLQLTDRATKEEAAGGELRTVFLDGKITVDEDYATIRRRLGYIA